MLSALHSKGDQTEKATYIYIYIYVICDLLDEAQLGYHIFRLKTFPFLWSTAPSSVNTLRDFAMHCLYSRRKATYDASVPPCTQALGVYSSQRQSSRSCLEEDPPVAPNPHPGSSVLDMSKLPH